MKREKFFAIHICTTDSYLDYLKNFYTSIRELQLNRKMGKRIGPSQNLKDQ